MSSPSPSPFHAWRWIPTLYFAQGLPFVAAMMLSVVMYKNLGISNTAIAFWTGWLYLPWVIKPLWAPLVELLGTKRQWIWGLQLAVGAGFAAVALALPAPVFFQATLVMFWLLAFASATHDIAADGFYLLALPPDQQAAFVGVRSTFYRVAMIAGQGALVWLAGWLQTATGDVAGSWALVFGSLAGLFVLAALYHRLVLPRPTADQAVRATPTVGADWWAAFATFFRRKDLGIILGFLLLYRLAEAQLVKLVTPFLLDTRDAGGLGLTTQQVGIVYGTIGVIALIIGGLAGGWVISRCGLRRMLWPMLAAIQAPNVVFVFLALGQPVSPWLIGGAVVVEQLGYGFGLTAYMVYMMYVAQDGVHKTAHYAICTGLMALGMMLPGMAAGWIQEKIGYVNFFIWVCLATLPSIAATARLTIDPAFGRKKAPDAG